MHLRIILTTLLAVLTLPITAQNQEQKGNNPIFDGWYADPEGIVFGDTYWEIGRAHV